MCPISSSQESSCMHIPFLWLWFLFTLVMLSKCINYVINPLSSHVQFSSQFLLSLKLWYGLWIPCGKAWSPRCHSTLRSGLDGMSLSHWGMPLRMTIGDVLFLFLSFIFCLRWEALLYCAPIILISFWEQIVMDKGLQNYELKQSCSPYNLITSGIC